MNPQNLINFVLFQSFWFAAVVGAAKGNLWIGPAGCLAFLALHLFMIRPGEGRGRELVYVLGFGVAGSLLDSWLASIGVLNYPTSTAWSAWLVPPWISSLWVAFAMLPRFSLSWLGGRPWLAVVFGALGGPLSYMGGARIGAVAAGEPELLTYGALAAEYAIVTPLLLLLSPARRSAGGGELDGQASSELGCC